MQLQRTKHHRPADRWFLVRQVWNACLRIGNSARGIKRGVA